MASGQWPCRFCCTAGTAPKYPLAEDARESGDLCFRITGKSMNLAVYKMLKETAEAGALITYTDVAKLLGIDMGNVEHRNQMSQLLDEISAHEHAQGRPLLSVVVIRKDLGRPGHGFFDLAKRLGQYSGHGENHEVLFFVEEFRKAEKYWTKRTAGRR